MPREVMPAAARAFVLACLLAAVPVAAASRFDPAELAWQPHPGAAVPLALPLTDDDGTRLALRELTGRPVILSLGYYRCPTLCGTTRADLMAALADSRLRGGQDYRLVVASIDPAETPADASSAKQADRAEVPGDPGRDWHYLTGNAAPLARSVGFPFRYDDELRQFAHPAGLVVLTADGLVSSYLEGVGFTGEALRRAVTLAARGGTDAAPSPVLLLCFHFDSSTGRYTLAIEKVLRLAAGATVLAIGVLLLVLHRRRRVRVGSL